MERLFAETVGRLENRVQQLETLGTAKPGEHRTVRSLGKGASARHTPLGLGRDIEYTRTVWMGRGQSSEALSRPRVIEDTHGIHATLTGPRPD